ncbi:unnamed protein product [Zymoseptoria tritici ST99CH_1E4]|uniref:Peptidase A1 domain-containing protein n=1 Tax=Zymoseptoria tritici ST99CH_1E4 TaxID=1276532 RepID=A0A2H1GAR3_ZYMTR|nr:unnamed protein product [Zymoseptoria tritici ST99CH_1E4]
MSVLNLNPSYEWQGNDGNWSTFTLRLGTIPQPVHVLPSTSGSTILVVDPQGCESAFTKCDDLRGSTFNQNASSTFHRIIQSEQQTAFNVSFDSEKSLEYTALGPVGVEDKVLLGNEGASRPLDPQVIHSYYDYFPFLGFFGLEQQNSSVFANETYRSILGSLSNSSNIPSAYWAYTAGSHWTETWASLTFGGYDKARGDISKGLETDFSEGTQTFQVSIKGITLQRPSKNVTAAGSFPVTSFLDSVVPEIWLAEDTCDTFADVYGLEWNEEHEMYFMNESQHVANLYTDPKVTFTIMSNSDAAAKTVDIVLPYGAFDTVASYPLAGIQNLTDRQRYFPLKRGSPKQQYLGRTFLQSAYMAADYDRQKFYLTQASYPGSQASSNIVKINRPGSSSQGLSTGAIAGIAVGAAAIVALAGAAIFWFRRKKKQNKRTHYSGSFRASSIGGTTMDGTHEGMLSQEYFKPGGHNSELPEDQFKQELDAITTARGFVRHHRAELSGSVRRTSQQSGLSRDSAVSPMGDRGRRPVSHLMQQSPASFGQPSPPHLSHRNSGQSSPGAPSPPMTESQYWGLSGPFELSAISREHASPVLPDPAIEPIRSEPITISDLDSGTVDSAVVAPLSVQRAEDTAYNEQLRANMRGPVPDGRS